MTLTMAIMAMTMIRAVTHFAIFEEFVILKFEKLFALFLEYNQRPILLFIGLRAIFGGPSRGEQGVSASGITSSSSKFIIKNRYC